MNLQRTCTRLDPDVPRQITTLLKIFGLSYPAPLLPQTSCHNTRKRAYGWWLNHEHELNFILSDVTARWRELVVKCHPDRDGGDLEQCKRLNQAYQRVVKLFAKKGISVN